VLGNVISNEWTVIIFGGLLVTILVKLGEKIYALSKEDKAIEIANQEVVEFLEQVLISHTDLSIPFLDSIISSIARKNNVLPHQMNSRIEAIEDVMVRVYQITYLPITERNNIVKSLIVMKLELMNDDIAKSLYEASKNKELESPKRDKSIIREVVPLYLAIVSMIIAFMSVLYYVKRTNLVTSIRITNVMLGIVLSIVILVIMLYLILSGVEKGKKRYQNHKAVSDFKEYTSENKDKKKSKKESKTAH